MTNPLLHTPLAIVGMGCCMPGARNLAEYWQLLREGRDAIVELPPDRLDRSLYFHPEKGHRGKTYSSLGGIIPERHLTYLSSLVEAADLENTDLCHRILCDVAIEACVQGGLNVHDFPWRNTGVYIGHSGGSTLGGDLAFGTLAEETLDYLFEDATFAALPPQVAREIIRQTANRLRSGRPRRTSKGGPDVEANFAASLIAKALQLNGPNFVIDAACASSLVALVAATLALNQGHVDAAIVGGASFNKSDSLVLFSHAQSCSAHGTRPFDNQADGLISSEGYAALIVKLLPKAIADGDKIQAVIRGIGISSDGRGRSLWAPRHEGQYEAVRRAYGPGLEPSRVQFIEAHATSTQVGDATELQALANFFGPHADGRKIPIGSVKSNIGHTLETAGLAGLTKAILALQHGEIPPTINLNQLNSSLQWDVLPFYVPTRVEPWPRPTDDQPRCAAVNAFGIGGLNVHVVVEEFVARPMPAAPQIETVSSSTKNVSKPSGVAIIGRGLLLPGVTTIESFSSLLCSQRVELTEAPESRWRKRIGVRAGTSECGYSPTARGGYILDYVYDWKTHKIPPKQISQANPLQFMLLDATRAALAESGYDKKEFDRATTAVVVGSIFGGEFGNQLHIGLRLPEIRRELAAELRAHGIPSDQIERLLDAYESRLLQAKPALLDETGSFTSSTLASRISKTFNLMGGALAIDAGDCSSLAALSVACDLLRSGANSLVLCAAAQRAMDLPAFESLALHGRLAAKGHDGYLPGEGVAVVLLKIVDNALRDGDRIWGVIEQIAAGTDKDLSRAIELASERAISSEHMCPWVADQSSPRRDRPVGGGTRVSLGVADQSSPRWDRPVGGGTRVNRNLEFGCGVAALDDAERRGLSTAYGVPVNPPRSSLVQQIGHTQAVHGLALLIKNTLDSNSPPSAISTHSLSGLAYHALISPHHVKDTRDGTGTESIPAANAFSSPQKRVPTARTFRLAAATTEQLVEQLPRLAGQGNPFAIASSESFSSQAVARMAVVASSQEEFSAKMSMAIQMAAMPSSRALLREKGVFIHRRREHRLRIALAFPGQGSQYPGMFRQLVETSAAAADGVREADSILKGLGFSSCTEILWGEPARLGTDIWTTQIAMLLADYLALVSIREQGITPDYVVGHSFGEFAALIAAESITLKQAIELTQARTQAIESAVLPDSGMLSISAPWQLVHELLDTFQGRVFLSHHNAPEQFVVGGLKDAIEEFDAYLAGKRIGARRLNVPIAFHTPLMQPTLTSWRESLQQTSFMPPRVPLISSVTNKFVADPQDIRDNLAHQMISPVHYVDLVERLARTGVDIVLEVGPQQVLTRLHRRILPGEDIISMAMDNPNRSAEEQLRHVAAELECLGWQPGHRAQLPVGRTTLIQLPIDFFDATNARKSRRHHHSRAAEAKRLVDEPVQRFDATQLRREKQHSSVRDSRASETIHPTSNQAPSSEPFPPACGSSGGSRRSARQSLERVSNSTTDPAAERFASLDQVLIDFVMHQTGYPAELINFDWDMEADLGIDSIKRAQLFGELREIFQLDTSDPKSLENLRTLRQISDLLRTKRAILPSPSANSTLVDRSIPAGNRVEAVRTETELERPSLEKFLIDFVVDQTGYPADIVDLDADFEADLGIDSIKKSQLFGELREQFQLDVRESDRFSLANFKTLRHVLELLNDSKPLEVLEPVMLEQTVAASFQSAGKETSSSALLVCSKAADTTDGGELAVTVTDSKQHLEHSTQDERYLVGLKRGQQNAATIRSLLRGSADRYLAGTESTTAIARSTGIRNRFTGGDLNEMRGLADGAGVHFDNIVAYQSSAPSNDETDFVLRLGEPYLECADEPEQLTMDARSRTHRYVLAMVPSPLRAVVNPVAKWNGSAVILGDNDLAQAIRRRFEQDGRHASIIPASDDPAEAIRELERTWQRDPAPHLFIVTPQDQGAKTTWSAEDFDIRRRRGVSTLFWFCQRWVKLATEADLISFASIVGVTSLGGKFGFDGQVHSVESGAVTGLLKAILIESWVAGNRTLPVKLFDPSHATSTSELVDSIWRELAVPSYDVEIAVHGQQRLVVRAQQQGVVELPRQAVGRGGTWVCTGGARGITAFAVRQLAKRYGLRLHLLGVSPLPQIPDRWRSESAVDLKRLKLEIMQSARSAGRNAIKEWEQVEKAIEIDQTLRLLREEGISVHYHSCDVSDRETLAAVLEEIRRVDGPIDGILHGAGVGKDARFDRKDPRRVEECIRAKVDGARALMELTRQDPLQFFVAFGSISGRFGANGHTDYSLANDMLCKQVDWYRRERPDVRSVAFHWHAWDDVGMATKPETKLALELVGMQFMPAAEGVQHLIAELEAATEDSEILITDDKYYRMFYPAETLISAECPTSHCLAPLLRDAIVSEDETTWDAKIILDPAREPFLVEHRLNDRPVLPIVIGMELLAEAAAKFARKGQVTALFDVEALSGMRFHTDRLQDVTVRVKKCDAQTMHCELFADFRSRDGQLVEANRCYLRGRVRLGDDRKLNVTALGDIAQDDWKPVQYPSRGSTMYLGTPLQCLRKVRVEQETARGRIIAPALIELAGSHRSVEGWIIPSAVLDACLYATGLLCWSRTAPGATLPVKFGALELGRMPQPGEACVVETRFLRRDGRFAVFEFTLFGDDGAALVQVKDYYVAWITS